MKKFANLTVYTLFEILVFECIIEKEKERKESHADPNSRSDEKRDDCG